MDKLVNKRYFTYDYPNRYTGVPYFYDTVTKQDVFGIGQQIKKDTDFVSHKVKPDDTLDSLALTYYNNPLYWWAIAYFNTILDPFIRLCDKFKYIKIPNISSIVFDNERTMK